MTSKWRRWVPGARHGPARRVAVYFVTGGPGPGRLCEMLGTCEQLRTWARTHGGFELENIPEDLPLLDSALDQAIELARSELGGGSRIALLGTQAGLYLGTVIVVTVSGARWRLWPNGHPVVRRPSGRDLDGVDSGNDRVRKGSPLLADAYAGATAGPLR